MKNIKFYSPHDIEQLKQTITTYKKTLASLKKGPSIEDCLVIKAEFDDFKKQLTRLENPTRTEGIERVPFNEYEEHVKQISIQIKEIHQYVEEINQEILTIFKQIIANTEMKVNSENNSPTLQYEDDLKPIEEEIPNPPPTLKKQPTFMQLQMMAGKVNVPPTQSVATAKEEPRPTISKSKQFNQPYFQLTSIPPSEMYNGLFKNTSREPALQFKNALETQVEKPDIPVAPSSPATNNKPNSSQQPASTTISDITIDSSTTQSPTQNNQEQEAIQTTSITQETSTNQTDPLEMIAFTNSIPIVDSLQKQQTTTSPINTMEANPPTNSMAILDSSKHDSLPSHTQINANFTPTPLETTEAPPTLQEEMTVPQAAHFSISHDEANQTINGIDNLSTPFPDVNTIEEKDIKKEKGYFFFNLFRKRN